MASEEPRGLPDGDTSLPYKVGRPIDGDAITTVATESIYVSPRVRAVIAIDDVIPAVRPIAGLSACVSSDSLASYRKWIVGPVGSVGARLNADYSRALQLRLRHTRGLPFTASRGINRNRWLRRYRTRSDFDVIVVAVSWPIMPIDHKRRGSSKVKQYR